MGEDQRATRADRSHRTANEELVAYLANATDLASMKPLGIQTMTGSPANPRSGDQILRFRQFSPGTLQRNC